MAQGSYWPAVLRALKQRFPQRRCARPASWPVRKQECQSILFYCETWRLPPLVRPIRFSRHHRPLVTPPAITIAVHYWSYKAGLIPLSLHEKYDDEIESRRACPELVERTTGAYREIVLNSNSGFFLHLPLATKTSS